RAEARYLLMAVDRPPPFVVLVLFLVVVLRFLVAGPVGKWETRLHRVFHFSIRAGPPFFFASFFLRITLVSAGFSTATPRRRARRRWRLAGFDRAVRPCASHGAGSSRP